MSRAQTLSPAEAAPHVPVEVAARGYWELFWLRFGRDRLAVGSAVYIILLLLFAFAGAPIFRHILGHGPNYIFAYGVNPHTLAPVGPWSHIISPCEWKENPPSKRLTVSAWSAWSHTTVLRWPG